MRQPRSSCWDMARQEQVLLLEPQHELKFRGRRGEGPALDGRGEPPLPAVLGAGQAGQCYVNQAWRICGTHLTILPSYEKEKEL